MRRTGKPMSTESIERVRLEVVPSATLIDELPRVYPAPNQVSVTCLPHHGPSRTVEASVELAGLGYSVVPHLAARSIASRAELYTFLERLGGAGISELFLVAGDRRGPAGPYSWSGELINDVKKFSPDFALGIAGYPEGHPSLTPFQLKSGLEKKRAQADSMVTQMCFSADAVAQYLEMLRREGVHLPVWIGVPGPISTKKLLAMGARLGVGRSLKLARGTGLAKALWGRGDFLNFDSNRLMRDIQRQLAHNPMFAGFHIYTFNDLGRLPGVLNGFPPLDPPVSCVQREASPYYPAEI